MKFANVHAVSLGVATGLALAMTWAIWETLRTMYEAKHERHK